MGELDGDALLFGHLIVRDDARDFLQSGGDSSLDPVVAGQHLVLAVGGVQGRERGRGELPVLLHVRHQPLELLMPHEAGVHLQQLQLAGVNLDNARVNHVSSSFYRFCECFFFQRASPSFSVHWPRGAP